MEMKWTGAGSGRQRRRRDRREGERDAEVGRRRRGCVSSGVQRRRARGTVVGGRDRGSVALKVLVVAPQHASYHFMQDNVATLDACECAKEHVAFDLASRFRLKMKAR